MVIVSSVEHQVIEMGSVQVILVVLQCAVVLVFLNASAKLFHMQIHLWLYYGGSVVEAIWYLVCLVKPGLFWKAKRVQTSLKLHSCFCSSVLSWGQRCHFLLSCPCL